MTEDERGLVQYIADTNWRLLRIAPLEVAIYAIGRRELAYLVEDDPGAENRDALIMGYIFQHYRRDLNNLALQERRLRNQNQYNTEKLEAMQKHRIEKERVAAEKAQADMFRALEISRNAKKENVPFEPSEFGFDFSVEEIAHYCSKIDTHRKLTGQSPSVVKVLAAFRATQQEPKAA